jgi:hypothetical protein
LSMLEEKRQKWFLKVTGCLRQKAEKRADTARRPC